VPDRALRRTQVPEVVYLVLPQPRHLHEAVTNEILGDLVAATAPRFMRLLAEFNVRGGIYTTVVAEHRRPGWAAPAPVTLP